MLCSEVIKKLQEIQDRDGDLPVFISQVLADIEGEMTLVEGIDAVLLCNPELKPELIRIVDWVD